MKLLCYRKQDTDPYAGDITRLFLSYFKIHRNDSVKKNQSVLTNSGYVVEQVKTLEQFLQISLLTNPA